MNIHITQYKWAGAWGPFRIKIPCGECAVTENIINDVIINEFAAYRERITFDVLPWLPHWFRLLLRGGIHAPIITIQDKVIFQGQAIDRGYLASELRKALVLGHTVEQKGVVIYSKENCKYCKQAKEILQEKNMAYLEKDIVKDPMATAELFYLTKQFFPKNKPVTTPQIWIDGTYIGGAEELEAWVAHNK